MLVSTQAVVPIYSCYGRLLCCIYPLAYAFTAHAQSAEPTRRVDFMTGFSATFLFTFLFVSRPDSDPADPAGTYSLGCFGQLCAGGICSSGADTAARGHDRCTVSHWHPNSQDPCCARAFHYVCRPAYHGKRNHLYSCSCCCCCRCSCKISFCLYAAYWMQVHRVKQSMTTTTSFCSFVFSIPVQFMC